MKIFAYTMCVLSYCVFISIMILECYGHHIKPSNTLMVCIATAGWTCASIYEYRKSRNGKR